MKQPSQLQPTELLSREEAEQCARTYLAHVFDKWAVTWKNTNELANEFQRIAREAGAKVARDLADGDTTPREMRRAIRARYPEFFQEEDRDARSSH